MEHELKQPSILRRFFASLPIVGTPVSLLIEHTEMGMAQYGAFVGLLRGLCLGLAIAAALIVSAEAVTFGFEMVRYEFGMRYLEGWKSGRRVAAQQRANRWDHDHTLLIGDSTSVMAPMKYFLVSGQGEAERAHGKMTAADEVQFLDEFEHQYYGSSEVKTLPSGETFKPFTYFVGGVATVDTDDKGECVVAARGDGSIMLVPIKEYFQLKAAK